MKNAPFAFGLLAAALCSAAPSALAQPVRPLVPLSASVFGTDGEEINGQVDIALELFDSAEASEPAYVETHTAVSVESSRFLVYLGEGASAEPLDATWLSGRDALWVAITIEDETLSPRLRVPVAPYAVVAGVCSDAQMLEGMTADEVSRMALPSCADGYLLAGDGEGGFRCVPPPAALPSSTPILRASLPIYTTETVVGVRGSWRSFPEDVSVALTRFETVPKLEGATRRYRFIITYTDNMRGRGSDPVTQPACGEGTDWRLQWALPDDAQETLHHWRLGRTWSNDTMLLTGESGWIPEETISRCQDARREGYCELQYNIPLEPAAYCSGTHVTVFSITLEVFDEYP